MRMARIGGVLALALVCGCSGSKREASHAEPAPASAPASALTSFHWVAGHWIDEKATGRYEEGWFGEKGGAMVGVFRLIGSKGPIVYEFIRQVEADGRLVMEITHFNGDGTQWPNQPVVFRSTSIETGKIVYEQDGVPGKVLTYEHTGKDTMRVTLVDPADARPMVFVFRRKD